MKESENQGSENAPHQTDRTTDSSGDEGRLPWKRVCLGAGLFALVITFVLGWSVANSHAFLSVSSPVSTNVLIVEGWAPDYILEQVKAEVDKGNYRLVLVSGGPLEKGFFLSQYKTYAELASETLQSLGLSTNQVLTVPSEATYRNRTYHSAVAIREALANAAVAPPTKSVNVVTTGTHARRTWTIYRRVLGADMEVGIISYPSQEYDSNRWWASSAGVKTTLTEAIGWFYEWAFGSGR